MEVVMPFVLLHNEQVIAQGPDSDFGALGPDERVEFRANGAAWDESDRLKDTVRKAERERVAAARKATRKEHGFRLVFAVSANHRFSTNRRARRISVGVRGDHGSVSVDSRRVDQLMEEASKYESTWWGVSVRELLVALDTWREAGCPRRVWKRLDWETATGPVKSKP